MAAPYDHVEFLVPVDGWPTGTRGRLIEIYPGGGGVEVDGAAESERPALDLLVNVARPDLRVLEPAARS